MKIKNEFGLLRLAALLFGVVALAFACGCIWPKPKPPAQPTPTPTPVATATPTPSPTPDMDAVAHSLDGVTFVYLTGCTRWDGLCGPNSHDRVWAETTVKRWGGWDCEDPNDADSSSPGGRACGSPSRVDKGGARYAISPTTGQAKVLVQ